MYIAEIKYISVPASMSRIHLLQRALLCNLANSMQLLNPETKILVHLHNLSNDIFGNTITDQTYGHIPDLPG